MPGKITNLTVSKKDFNKTLNWASAIVKKWPLWKQNALADNLKIREEGK